MRLSGLSRVLHASALGAVALGLCWLAGVSSAQAQDAAAVFVPPPRTIADITAILDREKPDPAKVAARKRAADASPPAGLADIDLAKFFAERSFAANGLGRLSQTLADLHKAVD